MGLGWNYMTGLRDSDLPPSSEGIKALRKALDELHQERYRERHRPVLWLVEPPDDEPGDS
jgi:hypothetical protein